MALDFNSLGGNRTQNNDSAKDRPKAKLWLNIGYNLQGAGKEGADLFVSLPTGIPLDTQEYVSTRGNSEEWRNLRFAQNGLLDQLVAAGNKLTPGEEKIIAIGENGLAIQLRKVREDVEPPAEGENPLAIKLEL